MTEKGQLPKRNTWKASLGMNRRMATQAPQTRAPRISRAARRGEVTPEVFRDVALKHVTVTYEKQQKTVRRQFFLQPLSVLFRETRDSHLGAPIA